MAKRMKSKTKAASGRGRSHASPSGNLTGAAILVRELESLGVKHIFGYPGGAILPVYDELTRSKITTILSGDERCAGHAAEGYARASGRPGVCMATSGPGATNLVTPLADAKMDSTPIIAITGQVRSHLIGKDAFQETPIVSVTTQVTKHNFLVTRPEDIASTIRAAFHIATTGRPGPVLVDITRDAQEKTVDAGLVDRSFALRGYNPHRELNLEQLGRALEEIQKAKRPVIYAGQGVILGGAEAQLLKFAEKTGIPVTLTVLGLGAFPASHPLCLQMLGMHGHAWANFAIDEADLVLALGARFDDRVTGNPKEFVKDARIVHVDVDPSEINKNKAVQIPVAGDIKEALDWLLPRVKKLSLAPWISRVAALRSRFPTAYENSGDQIRPQYVIETLSGLTQGKAILTTGVGQHQMWAAQFYRAEKTRSFITSGGAGTMGFGLPSAIGAQLARPGELVIDIDGDGSFEMNMNDMRTVADLGLPVKVIVLNNKLLGMVGQWQRMSYSGRYSSSEFGEDYPDFVAGLKAMYGIPGRKIHKKSEVPAALKEMIAAPGPYILEAFIPRDEDCLPMIPAGKTVREMLFPKGVRAPEAKDGR